MLLCTLNLYYNLKLLSFSKLYKFPSSSPQNNIYESLENLQIDTALSNSNIKLFIKEVISYILILLRLLIASIFSFDDIADVLMQLIYW